MLCIKRVGVVEMIIRELKQDEAESYISLSEFAFQYEMDKAVRVKWISEFDPRGVFGCFIKGKLAAAGSILSFGVNVNGITFESGGICGVATWPEYRRLGLIRSFMNYSLLHMRDSGCSLSLLHPFSIGFYRKFGWELFNDRKVMELTLDQLPRWKMDVGIVVKIDDWSIIQPVYEQYARKYNGMIMRNTAWWKERILNKRKSQIITYFDVHQKPRGYIYYQVEKRELTVHEFIYLDETAKRALWTYIGNHDSMIHKVNLNAPADDMLSFQIGEPSIQANFVPYCMARIVDLQAFVQKYKFCTDNACHFDIFIEDDDAPWNQNGYEMVIDSNGNAVLNNKAVENLSKGHLICSIGTITAILLGYRTASIMKSIGLLGGEIDMTLLLDRIIPRSNTFTIEAF